MKLAISNIAWNDDPYRYYPEMVGHGFSGLEIAPAKFSEDPYDHVLVSQEKQLELLHLYNLPIVSMQSLLFGSLGLTLFQSEPERNRLKSYLKKAIIYARAINCPVLVFGSPKNRISTDLQKDYPIAVDFFKELGEFAYINNTSVCIEPNPKEYGTNFINTISEANQLVRDVDSPGFSMIIDTGAMLINKNPPDVAVSVIENTKHVHISMPFLKPFNKEYEQHKDWLIQFLKNLKIAHYDQYISIEMIGAEFLDVIMSLKLIYQLSRIVG